MSEKVKAFENNFAKCQTNCDFENNLITEDIIRAQPCYL